MNHGRIWIACAAALVVTVPAPTALAACEQVGASPYDRPRLTADGSRVVFTTNAALVPEDTNRTLDVYAYDLATGDVELISAGGDARSSAPAVSADGRFVAFQSDSTNLVDGDDPHGVTDVFVRDRVAGTTELVSVKPDGSPGTGASSLPDISPDGSLVAFQSLAPDLVPDDGNGVLDVFVRDRNAATTTRVSVTTEGAEADGLGSFAPSISATGRVAFHSTASAWVDEAPGLRGFLKDGVYFPRNVFVHDLADGTTTHVSEALGGEPPDGLSLYPAITPDGRYVAFLSSATNLVEGDTNNSPDLKGFTQPDVFVRDLQEQTTRRVSVAEDGTEADGVGSSGPGISADGGRVVFESDASSLAPGDVNDALDVFVHEIEPSTTSRVSTAADGGDPGSAGTLSFGSVSPSVSADGSTVAFVSSAPGLMGAASATTSSPHLFGVFVRSLDDGALVGPLGLGCRESGPGVGVAPGVGTGVLGHAAAFGLEVAAWAGLAVLGLLMVGVALRARKVPALVGMTVVALAAGGLPASAHHHSAIQPGGAVLEEDDFGTASLNFVFRDRTTDALYVGTAAHALREDGPGSRIANDAHGEFGTLVYTREGPFTFSTQDFALVKIDPDKYGSVDPAVRQWGGPTAVARLDDLLPGLPTYQYGQGAFFRNSEPTRAKTGVLTRVSPDRWGYVGWFAESRHGFGGDSGSPILVGPDGRALGVVILFAAVLFSEPGVQIGPSIELILQELRLAGFDLELVTAPFHGPAGDASGMLEHCASQPVEDNALNEGCVRPNPQG